MNETLRALVPLENLTARIMRDQRVLGHIHAMPTAEVRTVDVLQVTSWGTRHTFGRGGVQVVAKLQDGTKVIFFKNAQTKPGVKFLDAVAKLVGRPPAAAVGVIDEKWTVA